MGTSGMLVIRVTGRGRHLLAATTRSVWTVTEHFVEPKRGENEIENVKYKVDAKQKSQNNVQKI